jgi:hypothetical protein
VYFSLKNLSKPRWHVPGWPESVKEVLTSASGGLPSLKQINGSVLTGTFSMFTLPWEKYELWARMQRNHNVLNKNFHGFWGSFSGLWARIQDIPFFLQLLQLTSKKAKRISKEKQFEVKYNNNSIQKTKFYLGIRYKTSATSGFQQYINKTWSAKEIHFN